MTSQKYEAARGPKALFQNLTQAEIEASLDSGRDWVSPVMEVDLETGTDFNVAALVKNIQTEFIKRHFPMDGDTTGCSISAQLQGRLTPHGAWVDLDVVNLAGFTETEHLNGNASAPVSSRISTNETRKYRFYRLRITAFSASGDAQGADGTPGFNYWEDSDTSSEALDMTPAAYTAPSSPEEIKLLFPPHAPIPAKNTALGEKYPVLVFMKGRGTYQNPNFFADPFTTSTGGTERIVMAALRKGFAVVCVAGVGNNSSMGTVDGYWKEDPEFDGSDNEKVDARVDLKWAIQWIRAYGVDEYHLDPDRIFLWGDDEAGSHALWAAYDGKDVYDKTSSDHLLRHSGQPNLVGARNPEVEWTVMDTTLVGPLESGTTAGSSAATLADATGTANLSLSRWINNKARTAAELEIIGRTPFYITGDVADTSATGAKFTYTDGVASWFVPTYPGPGDDDVTTQLSDAHLYLWALALEAFRQNQRANCPLVNDSVINSEVTLSTDADNAALINTNETTAASSNDAAIAWALKQWGISNPTIEPQATFDFYLIP